VEKTFPILEMKGIYKRFRGTIALDNVSLKLEKGEVLGLIGENGAGKSTLMKILAGAYVKDQGEILLNGKKVETFSTDYFQELGINIIYQELSLFLDLNSTENIFMHREITRGKGLAAKLNVKTMKKMATKILTEELSVNIDVEKPVRELRLAERQLIEIARSLSSKAQIIIMDEPTAALEVEEREQLFSIIDRLKKSGCSIIYVSHALEEVLKVCDRIMILRDGKNVVDVLVKELDVNRVISLMIGKTLTQQYPKVSVEIGEPVLKVKNLSKGTQFQDISFDLHKGEILGVAGLAGCGKSELVRSMFGIINYDKGSMELYGNKIRIANVQEAMRNKIAFLPADRKTEGLFLMHDINWNTSIASLKKITRMFINRKKENKYTNRYISELSIKASGPTQMAGNLSGGNQQKIMLGRWLMTDPDIIILEEPTRGIDVNAKAEVYRLMMDFVKAGKAVIVVSSEGPELVGICDRIIVMYEGKVTKVLGAEESTEEMLAYYSVHDTGGCKNEEQCS